MFPNFLMTGLTPLSTTNEIQQWENKPFTSIWPKEQKEEAKGISDAKLTKIVRRKPKRSRIAFTTDQLKFLENTYSRGKYLPVERRKQLASTLKIGERHIKIWFQNRRMKEKRESSESSCDSSVELSHQLSSPITESTEPTSSFNCSDGVKRDDEVQTQYQLPSIYHVPSYPHQYYNQYELPMTQHPNIDSSGVPTPPAPVDNNTYPAYYYANNAVYSHNYPNFIYQHENNTAMGYEYWCPDNSGISNLNSQPI